MNYRLRTFAAAVLSGSAILLAGCAPAIQGKWQGNLKSAGNVKATMEFKADGTLSQNIELPAPVNGNVTSTGTYKVEGDKVDMTVKDVQLDKAAESKIPPFMLTQVKEQIKTQVAKGGTQSATYKVEGDKLKLTISGQEVTLDKVK